MKPNKMNTDNKTVRLEETNNKRRLHIGCISTDLNESDYQELVKIFSCNPAEGVQTVTDEFKQSVWKEVRKAFIFSRNHSGTNEHQFKEMFFDKSYIPESISSTREAELLKEIEGYNASAKVHESNAVWWKKQHEESVLIIGDLRSQLSNMAEALELAEVVIDEAAGSVPKISNVVAFKWSMAKTKIKEILSTYNKDKEGKG